MQAPAHILAGIVIQAVLFRLLPSYIAVPMVIILSLISHAALDRLSRITYHPERADFTSRFWVLYHLAVMLCAAWLAAAYLASYTLGIIFSMLPDIDWLIIRLWKGSRHYGKPYIHLKVDTLLIGSVPWPAFPDLRKVKGAAVLELLISIPFILIFSVMKL